MRKKEIEKKLKSIISNSTPDVLDDILANCEKKKGFKNKVYSMEKEIKLKNKKTNFVPKMAGSLAIIILCICGLLGLNYYNKVYKTDTIIGFDVNPSIELKINKDGDVIKAIPLNAEGYKVLDDMDFERIDLDIAVNAIIGSMLKNGYITVNENSILVSVKNDNVNKANKLKEEISKEIEEILNSSGVKGSILSQAYTVDNNAEKIAKETDLSEGKVKLINKILSSNIKDHNGNAYTFESLSKLSINELNLLLTSKKTELKDVETTGSASETSYIGKDKAKQIAFSNAKVLASNVKKLEVELDCNDGKLVYEIEFRVSNIEYEYEIDAKTGSIIKKDADQEKNNQTNSSNNNRYDDDRYDDDDDHYDD